MELGDCEIESMLENIDNVARLLIYLDPQCPF